MSVNTFDVVKKSAKFGTLHADKILVGGRNGGWKSYSVTTLGDGNAIGTGPTTVFNEFRYRIDGTTLYLQGAIVKTGGADGTASSTGTYALTLPTGCSARMHPVGPPLNLGSFFVNSTTGPVALHGCAVLYTATAIAFIGQSDLVASGGWSHGSAAALRLTSGELTMGFSAMIELDPACAILASTYV